MLKKYHILVEEDLGDPGAVLIFDESGFPKKATIRLGLPGNTAAASAKWTIVRWAYLPRMSRHGYALLDKRLYIPEKWFADGYRARRQKCNFPEDLNSRPSRNWLPTCFGSFAPRASFPSNMLRRIRYMAPAPTLSAPSRRMWESPTSWR